MCDTSLLLLWIQHCLTTPSPQLTPTLPNSRHVVALPGLVCSPLPAGVNLGPGRLWGVSVLPGTRAAGFLQVEQQNSPASPASGQRELQRWRQQYPDLMRKEGLKLVRMGQLHPAAPVGQEPTPLNEGWGIKWENVGERRPRPLFWHFWDLCPFQKQKKMLNWGFFFSLV